MNKTVLITGASSGIGEGLAREFAKRGYNLALAARRIESLDQLADSIRAQYRTLRVETVQLDVNDTQAVQQALPEVVGVFGKLDIVIANAGIGGGGGAVGGEKFQDDVAIMQTNVIGAMATIDSAVKLFKAQGEGHVVAISSVASFRGLPGAGAYCASKAAISTYMDALQLELYRSPVTATCLYPGYIDTPINNMMKKRPFLIDVDKGAGIMVDLIERKVKRSTVPVFPWNVIGKFLSALPDRFLAGKV